MLEGLMQSYLESFGQGWRPRCEPHQHFRDSPSDRTALSSCPSNEGKTKHADKIYLGKRASDWAFGLR